MVSAQLQLNLFDAIIFAVLGLSALLSLFRGFMREVLSLVAWVGSAMITLYNVERAAAFLKPYIGNELGALIVGTLGTYFLSLIIISIVNAILLKYLKPGKEVGAVDNILGMLFGLFKGSLIIVLGFYILTLVYSEEDYPEWVKTSYSRPLVEKGTRAFVGLLPDYLRNITTLVKEKREEHKEMQEKISELKEQGVISEQEAGTGSIDMKKLQDMFNRTATPQEAEDGGNPYIRPQPEEEE